jgi:hypothetical protein
MAWLLVAVIVVLAVATFASQGRNRPGARQGNSSDGGWTGYWLWGSTADTGDCSSFDGGGADGGGFDGGGCDGGDGGGGGD